MAPRHSAFVLTWGSILFLAIYCLSAKGKIPPISPAVPTAISTQQSASAQNDPLAHDSRLKVHITYKRRATTIGETLRTLSAQTGVKLIADGVELGLTDISCAYEDVPLRDVLDSLSRVRNFVWKRRKDNALLLQDGYNEHQFDAYRPHTEAEAEMWRQGKKFLAEFNKLPAGMQKDMTAIPGAPSPNPEGYGTPVASLLPVAQQAINAMFQAYMPEFAASHPELNLSNRCNDTSRSRVTLSSDKQEGFQAIHIGIGQAGNNSVAGFSLDMPFMVFTDPRDNVERIVSKDTPASSAWRSDKEDEQSRREYDLENARLNKKVTLASHRYSLYEALQEIKTQTGVDFATQLLHPKTSSGPFFACADMPLKDALNALCKAHSYADEHTTWTWGICKSGVLLLHCTPDFLPPNSPAVPVQTTRK